MAMAFVMEDIVSKCANPGADKYPSITTAGARNILQQSHPGKRELIV
jgi:hypothetical protein